MNSRRYYLLQKKPYIISVKNKIGFSKVAKDGSSFAMRISCLKIEPKVSIFPAL